MDEVSPENSEFKFQTIGEQLKAERERRGMSLSDVAARTRIPIRHLQSIETSDFGALPGSTYSIGFARSYARSLEMDDVRVAADLRTELAETGHNNFVPTPQYQPADASRVPSRLLAWTAGGIGALLLATYLIWRSGQTGMPVEPVNATGTDDTQAVATAPADPAAKPAAAVDASGAVVITAKQEVWVKIYDKTKKRLFENTMKAGDSFTVPADANGPMILTGRPDVLTVTVGGKEIPPLGPPNKTVADLEISAAALAARAQAAPAAGVTDGATPATGAAPAPVPTQ